MGYLEYFRTLPNNLGSTEMELKSTSLADVSDRSRMNLLYHKSVPRSLEEGYG